MRWHILACSFLVLLILAGSTAVAQPADGSLQLLHGGSGLALRVWGDPDDEWRFETSINLVVWQTAPGLGTAFSGRKQPSTVALGTPVLPAQFLRAVRTAGLFDPHVMRTIHLTFQENNWRTILAARKASGSNLIGSLTMDGMIYPAVGVRYKGNSSYRGAGMKKSMNIEIDYTNSTARLMGYRTVNLNNAFQDETIMREPLFFNIMKAYTVCPQACFARLMINGEYWGVYSCAQQQDTDLLDEWFPSDEGDRWRAPNMPGGGGFSSGTSALSYLGTNVASYRSNYELKSDLTTNTWQRLIFATQVLAQTPDAQLRDKIEGVLAVDRWLWFLALENVFADDDSYFNKGADYMFYYEPESGRIHPIEHDGNEAFVARDVRLSPVEGANNANRPVLRRLLGIPELRQRYIAHIRTTLEESFNPTVLNPAIAQYEALSRAAIAEDTKKGYSMTAYATDLTALKVFIQQRHSFLTNHAELRPVPPRIVSVSELSSMPVGYPAPITAHVEPNGPNGVDSVWLYHRGKSYGRFTAVQMFDDGAHEDGAAGDSVFGAWITNSYLAGAKVRFYIEARSMTAPKASCFAPARAEQEAFSYRVALSTASTTAVVINELMALNTRTLPDPQGEYDDWIELHNPTDEDVDLSGCHLSDEPHNPRKWVFPAGTIIRAGGFLVVWADEDGSATPGLHASFRLSAERGETVYLADTDQNLNAVLDSVTFGPQEQDRAYGRSPSDPSRFEVLDPTPGSENK